MCDQCTRATLSSSGSRRRRLWDLPTQCHCPVIGVCFLLPELRQLVSKALGAQVVADDYEVHVGTVAQCQHRQRLTEVLHKDLETRYSRTIEAFKGARSTAALAERWSQATQQGQVPAAFWAVLTHPRCDAALQEQVLRDMHMLQHQAGASERVDTVRFQQLVKENGVLARELGKVQERCTRVITEKCAEIEQLGVELIRLRAHGITQDTRIACLTQEMEALKASLPDYDDTTRLLKRLAQLNARHGELETYNAHLRQQLHEAQIALKHRDAEAANQTAAVTLPAAVAASPIHLHLRQKNVLCVGGRHGNVTNYRDVIEKAGGRFSHHDGGVEDRHSALEASLAAADLVICQTGCISHNAYWRVKDFCKRTGKQCVFVENPSTSSLVRSVRHIVEHDPALDTATTLEHHPSLGYPS